MKLSEIFNDLQFGQLRGQSLAQEGATIREIDYPKLVTAINPAIKNLYARFKLKYNEVVLILDSEISKYTLNSKYAISNVDSLEPIKWIQDSNQFPFTDDIVVLHSAKLEDGTILPINDASDCMSIFSTSYDTIKIPDEVIKNYTSITLVYEASPTLIECSTDICPPEIDVAIPDIMAEALAYYAAAKYMEQSTAQDKVYKSVEFLRNYEIACSKIDSYGLTSTEIESSLNVGMNQWP